MKCHCKYCFPRFFCQTINHNDFCYYRHPIKSNGTNDFGCVQADVARFLVCLFSFSLGRNVFHFIISSAIQLMQIIKRNVALHSFVILIINY